MWNRLATVWQHDDSRPASRWDADRAPGLRLVLLWLGMIAPLFVVAVRMVQLQVTLRDDFATGFEQTYEAREEIPARDGRILAADGSVLAGETERYELQVHFRLVQEPADAGWLRRTDTQYHWHNAGFASFDEYLETMSSRHRKVTRRERRDALEGLTVRWLTGENLTESVWDAFFEFYEDTGNRKWGRPYLNRKFFSLLSAAMADRIVLMFAYDGERPIAGTLNLLGADTLYGRYWGATQEVPFLHFELCYYQAIDFAIAHKLKTVEAGAQGEHKLARGYAPASTRSIHWIGHPGLRHAVATFVDQERVSVQHDQDVLSAYTPFRKGDAQSS